MRDRLQTRVGQFPHAEIIARELNPAALLFQAASRYRLVSSKVLTSRSIRVVFP